MRGQFLFIQAQRFTKVSMAATELYCAHRRYHDDVGLQRQGHERPMRLANQSDVWLPSL